MPKEQEPERSVARKMHPATFEIAKACALICTQFAIDNKDMTLEELNELMDKLKKL